MYVHMFTCAGRALWLRARTLTGPAVWVEDETRVTGAGIRARDIGTQLLAVTIATFINIWSERKRQIKAWTYCVLSVAVNK